MTFLLICIGGLSLSWFGLILFMSFFHEQKIEQAWQKTLSKSKSMNEFNTHVVRTVFQSSAKWV
jgi:hypothetical protein